MNQADLASSPFQQFGTWLAEARTAGLKEPSAMALATVGASGTPSVRMVLLRGWDEEGFRFFTNYESQKGHDLEVNPMASLLFYWDSLQRQVRIDGEVLRLSGYESDTYFASRPRESQLGAWASPQSRPLQDRKALLEAVEEASRCFPDEVRRPPWWGGFRLVPVRFEFWISGESRLHDRFRYEPHEEGWTITRLAP
jgi:pyridoxamine 5'-phosphate oxidase